MTTTSSAVLRLGLSDVAQLANVQRPVVSMWRARSAGSDRPFPAPIETARGQEWFDGTGVVDWLIATGRGNNPSAREDLAAYASLDGGSPQGDQVVFDGITALLCLSAITSRALGSMSRDDLIDLADEVDPDETSCSAKSMHWQHVWYPSRTTRTCWSMQRSMRRRPSND